MPTLSITWGTMRDNNVCPVCQALEGYTWTFITGRDSFPTSLTHPVYGEIWNMFEGSMAHGEVDPSRCRCHLTPEFDLADVLAKVQKLYDDVKASVEAEAEAE
jgi:hypothetical protein